MATTGALFTDLIATLGERGRTLIRRRVPSPGEGGDLVSRCEALLSGKGEASGTAAAAETLALYASLDPKGRHAFFTALLDRFGPDRALLDRLAAAWLETPGEALAGDLHAASEPRRQELLRRLNRAPDGTRALVAMRADLLDALRTDKSLAPVDRDFAHLLSSWFNRGFLVLRRIDWSTPAIVLEKIIRYEAVHEIRDFPSLRLRIDPPDRRCYGFFHPALPDEPLIFVEVALTDKIPGAIAPLLSADRAPVLPDRAKVAVFYSISNCQRGLAGISFGNFLIKQVVEELRREFARLETFVTLSPVPGFRKWLRTLDAAHLEEGGAEVLARLDAEDWASDALLSERARRLLEPLLAVYLLHAKRQNGRPIDLVASFHLGNGARLERINWFADLSTKGMSESAGLMVNYLYDLEDIEANHEAFANNGDIAASAAVRKLIRPEATRALEPASARP